MFRVRKKVFDTYLINRCKRDVCKCIVSLREKESVTVKEVVQHRECFNCDKINRGIKKREMKKVIVTLKEDRTYPPLL